MKIIIAGGSGMIGTAITRAAEAAGHQVTPISIPRPPKAHAHEVRAWHAELKAWTPETFAGADAVMFFGGEPVASRWTSEKLRRIDNSRHLPCAKIAQCVAALEQPPTVIVSASGSGYYGSRGDELLTEESPIGHGILAASTADWEAAWQPARDKGISVSTLRLGVVVSPRGGALKMMLPAFKLGLGGPLGNGRQWMPWISLPDAARLALYCAENSDKLAGPVNAVAPEPVQNAEFVRALGRALNRPAIIPVPAAALRVTFGQMANETILASCREVPARAIDAGFTYYDTTIDQAFRAVLSNDAPSRR